nr:sensor histidine kinase [Saccharibacillus qingshengii]
MDSVRSLFALLFTDLLIWIDSGIALRPESLLYLNLVLAAAFAGFLGWRFVRETKHARRLLELAESPEADWAQVLPAARFLDEQAANRMLQAVDLWHAQQMSGSFSARSSDRDDMAAWVHEVKTPLTAMKLLIDADRSSPAVRRLESEWLRVHLLVDRRLYMSRLPSLEADCVMERTELRRLAAREVRDLAAWCVEKNIAVEFAGEDAEVRTDLKWCRFVLRQLLTNAVKYSPDGGLITLNIVSLPNGAAALTVRDEGPGIAPHDLPRIFDKGFTGGNGRLQNAATGLGLYLARTVADKIGLALEVRSKPDAGTSASLNFPAANPLQTLRGETAPKETIPSETDLSETVPGETVPSERPPLRGQPESG